MVEEDKVKLKRYTKIFNSPSLVKKKLIEELADVREKMDDLFKKREEERKKIYKEIEKQNKKAMKQELMLIKMHKLEYYHH